VHRIGLQVGQRAELPAAPERVTDVGHRPLHPRLGPSEAIAVARSVYSDARILLLDEPLAAMGAKEGALILDLIRDLKERGNVSIIIHNYAQVLDVCDRVNLLQHGEITFDKRAADTSLEELTELVVAEYRAGRGRRR
jgi:simple sugar transport system ATP-binding protein